MSLLYYYVSVRSGNKNNNVKEAFFMKADTRFISYVPGEYYLTQGHKGDERKHKNKRGQYITPTGFGWGTVSKPSKIILGVNVDGKNVTVFVDRYFKDKTYYSYSNIKMPSS